MKKFISVNQTKFFSSEKIKLNDCLKSGWISSNGKYVVEFEKKISNSFHRKYSTTVVNGSAALDVAIRALNIKKGDEVIMPTFSIISILLEVLRIGAKPIFIDSDLYTWNMRVEEIEKNITKKTKAIIVVHIYGLPVDLDPVLKVAKKYNLKVIEDAAELIGQTYKGKPCGSFGDVSTFSFYANKHITTGEGGALLTNNKTLDKKFRSLRNLCFEKKRFVHREIGWNLRMTNLQASIGSAQLNSLKKIVFLKRKIGAAYNENLKTITDFIQLPIEKTQYADNIYWVYGIVVKKKYGISAQSLMNYLKKKRIETRPFFFPLHQQPIVKKFFGKSNKSFPNSEFISKYGLYLPSELGIKKKEIEYISKTLINFFKKKI